MFGLDKIEFLQSHENIEIYQKAFDIIERYFGTEEEDKEVCIKDTGDLKKIRYIKKLRKIKRKIDVTQYNVLRKVCGLRSGFLRLPPL